jgi:hypothetical protein
VHAFRKKDLIVEGIVLKSQLKEGGEKFEEWRRQVALAGGEDAKDIFTAVEKIV